MPDGADGRPGSPGVALADFVPLAVELCDLKRLRDDSGPDSLASRMFRTAWGALQEGMAPDVVAHVVTARALAACRLGSIDGVMLHEVGLSEVQGHEVLRRSFDEVSAPVDKGLAARLRAALVHDLPHGAAPDFAERLIRQPRAGATCPGKPRIVLEPPEGHGDHCFVVAVLGCTLAPRFGADPATAFVAGLAHHLHNATLPDSGFAGEILLGEHLNPIIARLFERELATLAEPLRAVIAGALATIPDASTPGGQAFHAADVIDRVLQIRHFEDVARFRLEQALQDMELVHAGPTQAFHHAVLRGAGLG